MDSSVIAETTYLTNQKLKTQQQLSPKSRNFPLYSIVIPCYNESKTIKHVIDQVLNLDLFDYEIIVVDDGSSDDSVNILKQIKNSNSTLKVLQHSVNMGYGRSVIDGILHSRGELIITIDSDGQHDPYDIPKLCLPVRNRDCDFVIGSRYKGRYNYQIPLLKRAGEAFIEAMILLLYGKRFINNQGGLRVFHREMLPIFDSLEHFDMAMTTEILVKAITHGFRVKEVGIDLRDRPVGFSNQRLIPLFFNVLICLLKNKIKRP